MKLRYFIQLLIITVWLNTGIVQGADLKIGGNISYLTEFLHYSKASASKSYYHFKYKPANSFNVGAHIAVNTSARFGAIIRLGYQLNDVSLLSDNLPRQRMFLRYQSVNLQANAFYNIHLKKISIAPALGFNIGWLNYLGYGAASNAGGNGLSSGSTQNAPSFTLVNEEEATNSILAGVNAGLLLFPVKKIGNKVDYYFSVAYTFYPLRFPMNEARFVLNDAPVSSNKSYYLQGLYSTLEFTLYLAYTIKPKNKAK